MAKECHDILDLQGNDVLSPATMDAGKSQLINKSNNNKLFKELRPCNDPASISDHKEISEVLVTIKMK